MQRGNIKSNNKNNKLWVFFFIANGIIRQGYHSKRICIKQQKQTFGRGKNRVTHISLWPPIEMFRTLMKYKQTTGRTTVLRDIYTITIINSFKIVFISGSLCVYGVWDYYLFHILFLMLHIIPRILFVVVVVVIICFVVLLLLIFAKLSMLCDYYCHLNLKIKCINMQFHHTPNRHRAYANYSFIFFYRHDHSWITSLCI